MHHHSSILLYITFLILSPSLVSAQFIVHSYQPTANALFLGITLTVTTVVIVVIFVILNVYCKPSIRPRNRADDGLTQRACIGLDPSVLETFPVFKYSEVAGRRKVITGPVECSVCLSPFEADETLRLLPKCNHVFHLGCLDPWLKDHTSCPLCRMDVVPQLGELTQLDAGRVDESGSELGEEVNEVGNHKVFEGDIEEGHFGKYRRWNSTGHVAEFERAEMDGRCSR
ncbi:RING-H2 finger protein ATL11 [Beta vulgaris subsp. vulgaris]|uniref:RING-H2 finger protein ATL11 n=1 Tax=Beta vulgaris subsp. vulgaris TaxID=3555 RepID=UPI0020374F27|nr:RING-H2 finger protein ATL11 [Beta vulgaris subsp. vulgaris]